MKKRYNISQIHTFFENTNVEKSCSLRLVKAYNFNDAIIKVMRNTGERRCFKDVRIDITERE